MKRLKKIGLILGLASVTVLGLRSLVMAANPATDVTVSATATVAAVLTGVPTRNLVFPFPAMVLVPGGDPRTVPITDDVNSAMVTFTGDSSAAITVTTPANVWIRLGTTDSLTVTLTHTNPLPTVLGGPGGTATVTTGGTAQAPAGQAAGTYTGDFIISAIYN
ncbi:DUF4402 domain-containing protein [candidate division WOR-3 bacterium]|nr:DUF4402 domain-containing protein [candidate division WOR-3 bacterium]